MHPNKEIIPVPDVFKINLTQELFEAELSKNPDQYAVEWVEPMDAIGPEGKPATSTMLNRIGLGHALAVSRHYHGTVNDCNDISEYDMLVDMLSVHWGWVVRLTLSNTVGTSILVTGDTALISSQIGSAYRMPDDHETYMVSVYVSSKDAILTGMDWSPSSCPTINFTWLEGPPTVKSASVQFLDFHGQQIQVAYLKDGYLRVLITTKPDFSTSHLNPN